MGELVGTTKRPVYPLEAGLSGEPWRYFSQLSENGLWIEIYDNKENNKMIGMISLRMVESMKNNYKASGDEK